MKLRRQPPVYSPLSAAALRQAIVSGLSPGRNGHGTLRAELARTYDAARVLLFAAGTQALQVALETAMQSIGDRRVALPAFTCFDVASAAAGAGARVRCYDVEPATLGPDLTSLQGLLERGIRIVVVSPLYGYPVDWNALTTLLRRFDAIVVEDAAQSGHASWRGRPVGSLGSISVLSFGRGKGWTGGAGGALLLRNSTPQQDALEQHNTPTRGAEVRLMGVLAAQWLLGHPARYAIPLAIPWLHLGETRYHVPAAPAPMTRAAAACLTASRAASVQEASARRVAATIFLDLVAAMDTALVKAIEIVPGASPGFLRLPLRLSPGLAALGRSAAARRLGLAPSYPSVLPAIPQFQPSLEARDPTPGADELVRTLCTVPTHSLLTAAERMEVTDILQAYARQP